jgi:hypothetical protein
MLAVRNRDFRSLFSSLPSAPSPPRLSHLKQAFYIHKTNSYYNHTVLPMIRNSGVFIEYAFDVNGRLVLNKLGSQVAKLNLDYIPTRRHSGNVGGFNLYDECLMVSLKNKGGRTHSNELFSDILENFDVVKYMYKTKSETSFYIHIIKALAELQKESYVGKLSRDETPKTEVNIKGSRTFYYLEKKGFDAALVFEKLLELVKSY